MDTKVPRRLWQNFGLLKKNAPTGNLLYSPIIEHSVKGTIRLPSFIILLTKCLTIEWHSVSE